MSWNHHFAADFFLESVTEYEYHILCQFSDKLPMQLTGKMEDGAMLREQEIQAVFDELGLGRPEQRKRFIDMALPAPIDINSNDDEVDLCHFTRSTGHTATDEVQA